ncbi:hypothetical protein NA78x_001572 [Anatilimnocola sp. NA78]|uniref:hypothetical protein n=1 Tax=Anatilimnocola sp. NA78 TaxID=3415683 RepID=UPI003CE49B96
MPANRAPLIVAVVLLLLPVLYVGSYLALVVPQGMPVDLGNDFRMDYYRLAPEYSSIFFAPLEWVDKMIRPEAWWKPMSLDSQLHSPRVPNFKLAHYLTT